MFPNFFTFLHFSQELLVWSWSNFDFCSCCGTLQPLAMFPNFLTFLHFSQELLVWSWSNFDFCSCCGTLQPIVKFQNFLTFLHFSEELLVFIKLWFLFMLWHSAATCKVSQISQFLAFFPRTTDLILIKLWFLFMLWHSAANYKVSKFSHFFAFFWRNYWSDHPTFDFCSCCCILQPVAKFHKFLSFWQFSLELLFDLDQTFIFVYAVALCSQL